MVKAENQAKAIREMRKSTGNVDDKKTDAEKKEEKLSAVHNKRVKELSEKYKFTFEFLDDIHQKCDDMLRDHKEKKAVYTEKFEEKSLEGMYMEAWDLLKGHM